MKPHSNETAYFAAGCFWGVQHFFDQQPGVLSTRVGYMGGHQNDPTYDQVCMGMTGHVETVEVVFEPSTVSYEALVKLFFEIHDFEQTNGQGPDIGAQYLSVIFVANQGQREVAEAIIDELGTLGYEVATSVRVAERFWSGEEYHEKYYAKKGGQPYCHVRRKIF